jgi:hypothetical protein
MLYKNPFESLTILQFFYKCMPKECIKWCNWFQKFCIKNPSLYATTCSLGQFDEKKIIWNFFNFEILKQMATKEMIHLLNHLANFFIFIMFLI